MRPVSFRYLAVLLFMAVFLTLPNLALSEEEKFHSEVLSVSGEVTATDLDGAERVLQEGDLLSVGETVRTRTDSTADLAFDKEWKNVTHLEENSKMKIGAIAPGQIDLKQGAVFAKLRSLPKNSTFEVKTPTAVATVRGTEYRTMFTGGQTQVFNVSPSKVYVYGMNTDGSADLEQELVLEQSKKTQIVRAGQRPQAPQPLSAKEERAVEVIQKKVEEKIQAAESSGRVSKIQSIAQIEKALAQRAEEKKEETTSRSQVGPNDSDTSRVVDLRRRPFKKTDS